MANHKLIEVIEYQLESRIQWFDNSKTFFFINVPLARVSAIEYAIK